jgi:hypothetical protein
MFGITKGSERAGRDHLFRAEATTGKRKPPCVPATSASAKSAARLSVLEVSCNRCDRPGRLNVDRLIAEHGEQPPIPALRQIVAADCPRMIEGKISDPWEVHFPGLAG